MFKFPKKHEDLEIQVDFYKPSGKWYGGGKVNIGTARLFYGNVKQAIVDNQNILYDGWQENENFIVVINDTSENWADKNYQLFNKRIYQPHEFKGLKRKDFN